MLSMTSFLYTPIYAHPPSQNKPVINVPPAHHNTDRNPLQASTLQPKPAKPLYMLLPIMVSLHNLYPPQFNEVSSRKNTPSPSSSQKKP